MRWFIPNACLTVISLFAVGVASPVIAGPDLYVSEFQLSPDPPVQGQPVNVRIGVYNRGNIRSDKIKVGWWPGENFPIAKTWTLDGLNARGGRILTYTYPGYKSWYSNLVTKVRIIHKGREDDKANNIFQKTIRVTKASGGGTTGSAPAPDLYVSEFRLTPNPPVRGQPIQVRVGVYNKGNAPAGPYTVQWWPGENYPKPAMVWKVNGNNARGGKILNYTYPGYPSAYGRITTKVVVDNRDSVKESNEANNIYKQTISVKKR